MTVDPDPLAERSSDNVSEEDLEMLDHPEDDSEKAEMGEAADVDPKLKEKFDL